jgi:ribonuclease HI
MTLTAVIEGLRALPQNSAAVIVHVQEGHVLDALSNGWPAKWRERNWVKHDGTPVKNRDLWEPLAAGADRHKIHWRPFISSEESDQQQERVLAIAAAQR